VQRAVSFCLLIVKMLSYLEYTRIMLNSRWFINDELKGILKEDDFA
jgi:hypothetical protein